MRTHISLFILTCMCIARSLWAEPPTNAWQLTFEDSFEGESLDGSKWSIGYPWGRFTGWTKEYIADECVRVQDGRLHLTYRKGAEKHPHLSGAIHSRGKFAQRHGYFEASIRFPSGAGLHGGFWMLAQPPDPGSKVHLWPPEIDIVELVGKTDPKAFNNVRKPFFTAHWLPVDGDKQDGVTRDVGFDCTEKFHIYGLEWNNERLVWYVDGREVFRRSVAEGHGAKLKSLHLRAKSEDGKEWDISAQPFFLLLNLHVGNWLAGEPDAESVGREMVVDWVKAYRPRTN